MTDATVAIQDPILDWRGVGHGASRLDIPRHALAVLGVRALQHVLPRRGNHPRLEPKEPEQVIRPLLLVGLRKPLPAPETADPLPELEQTQRLFGHPAVGSLHDQITTPLHNRSDSNARSWVCRP